MIHSQLYRERKGLATVKLLCALESDLLEQKKGLKPDSIWSNLCDCQRNLDEEGGLLAVDPVSLQHWTLADLTRTLTYQILIRS